jgi:hypothetical protein
MGLDLYIATLQRIPYPAMRAGALRVLETHKFKSLPLPADIIEQAQPEKIELEYWAYRLGRALRLVDGQPLP